MMYNWNRRKHILNQNSYSKIIKFIKKKSIKSEGGIFVDIAKEVKALEEELIHLRRDFHTYPELGYQEFRSQEIIEKYLEDLGLEVNRMTKTGVVGLLKGENPGPTLLMRADMDALPIEEETGLSFQSKNKGLMHACAHDGHMATLLIAAKILTKSKDKIHGNIKFVFQPNEEDAGAKAMVKAGVLENPKVDASIGIHIWTPVEVGQISVQEGPVMGAHDNFKVTIKGRGGHSSSPHNAIDPVIVAAQVILSAQHIETKQINALTPTVVSFSSIHAGTASNIIPEEVIMQGTLRYLYDGSDEGVEKPRVRLEKIVKGISETFGAEGEIEFYPANFTVSNHPNIANLVKKHAAEVVGEENVVPYMTMAGEDFSEFTIGIPSTFYFIGAGNQKEGKSYPHHHPKFDIDERALSIGVEMHVRTALDYLSSKA